MATRWQTAELERRTAARIAQAGFVPAVNVVHAETSSEFDVYAFLPQPGGFSRLMVQCSVPRPSSEKLSALRACADTFGADNSLYVTAEVPHTDQRTLAELHGVTLLSESPNCSAASAAIAGQQVDAQAPQSVRERAIVGFLQCVARLRRVAYDHRSDSAPAEAVVSTWNRLDAVALITDPFERLSELYAIHFDAPTLAEDCALAEGLGSTGNRALKEAYAYNGGTYTQSALTLQTLNRVHTLISLSECALVVASGHAVPAELDDPEGRRGPLIRWLAARPTCWALAPIAFEFMYGWGGLYSARDIEMAPMISAAVGVQLEDVVAAKGLADAVLRNAGMNAAVKRIAWNGHTWQSLFLLPYFAKGIGLRRLEAEAVAFFQGTPWDGWKHEVVRLTNACRIYEEAH